VLSWRGRASSRQKGTGLANSSSWRSPLEAAPDAPCGPRSDRGRRTGVAFRPLDEHTQTDGFMHETDGCTYAIDEDGDLLWFVSPGVHYRRRKREAETAEPPAEPDS
jgi:hypothetical protein